MNIDWFRNKRITVMGLGLHGGGVGTARWLMRRGAAVTVTDLKDQHALASSISALERAYLSDVRRLGKGNIHRIRYVLGHHDEADFSGADMVIQNPAVPRENPLLAIAKDRGIPIESDISLFFLLCPFPITGVSGTRGKTTTTTLIAEICRAHDDRTVVGGNIRIPALDSLDKLLALAKRRHVTPPPVVLELSSWHLESLAPHRRSPHVAVLTTIMEDHLNRYRDMEDYALAKAYLVAFQAADDVAVMNAENSWIEAIGLGTLKGMAAAPRGRRVWFSTAPCKDGDACFIDRKNVVIRENGKVTALFPISDIRLPGKHNIGNVLAACAAARTLGVPARTVRKVVRGFHGVPGRLEELAVKRGIRFVNDTTATTPDAAVAALETLGAKKRRIILLAGGADKKLRFEAWAEAVKKRVKHLVLFDGSATPKMEQALVASQANVPMAGVRSMREAFVEAMRHAKKGDIVLLSPGCASFGLFQHEFDRGDQFAALVRKTR